LLMLATMGPSRSLSSRPCARQVILECRPPLLAISQRLPREYINHLVAGLPDEGRAEADDMDALLFPNGKKLLEFAPPRICVTLPARR
jgi:hypothetical protein